MNWKRISPHLLIGDDGYKICRTKVGENIYYRPSFNGSFISAPQTDLDAAKAICTEHVTTNSTSD